MRHKVKLFSLCALFAVSCTSAGVHGEYSMPAVFVTDGEVDYTNPYDPVSGENIKDASVTAINETTGQEVDLEWTGASGNMQRGSYGGYQQDFPHAPGDEVSIEIGLDRDDITGGPTVTPDSTVTLTAPAHESAVSLPFDITWDVTDGMFLATDCFVFINSDTTGEAYMDVVPLSDGSYTITESLAPSTGPHHITVWPTNIMGLDGKRVAGGSAVYVKSTELSYSHAITIE